MAGERVVVAMSGGVDSSVAAALLQKEGYQVIGITMQIWRTDSEGRCCGLSAIEDAKKVAFKLGIPHYLMDFRDIFEEKVIADFCREYRRGRTPNPCIRCNRYLKFAALREKAAALGADLIATGHHARVIRDEKSGRYLLLKGSDVQKDQSYFLYAMTQEQLAHTLFPIGHYQKAKVREIARELGLPTAAKRESQDICFIPDGDYTRFMKEYLPGASQPGLILDTRGKAIGTHQGITYYTIGQRHGLGLAGGEPLYVIAIDTERNAIIVGSKQEAMGTELIAADLNWISLAYLTQPATLKARIRCRAPEAGATVSPMGEDEVHIQFAAPQWAITPGQAVVFYDGEVVAGGGTIEARKGEAVSFQPSAIEKSPLIPLYQRGKP